MGIPHAMVILLQAEGIESVSDLADFDKIPFNSLQTTSNAQEDGL